MYISLFCTLTKELTLSACNNGIFAKEKAIKQIDFKWSRVEILCAALQMV